MSAVTTEPAAWRRTVEMLTLHPDGVLGRSERSVAARRRILVITNTLDAFVAEHGALATRLQAQALLTLGSLSPQTLGVEHALPLSLSQVRLPSCA